MTVGELIEALQKEDPTKRVYVPLTTYLSPASKPKVIDCVFNDEGVDSQGVLICAEGATDNDEG